MALRKTASILLVLSALIIAGCTGFNLRQANHELVDLYRAKIEAVEKKQWPQEASANAALANLAKEAAAQGADGSNSTVNRIAFYRVAATAAWQAEMKEVVNYAEEGARLCTPQNFAQAPRDCGMLSVIPDLASTDELTGKMDALQSQLDSGANPPSAAEIAALHDDIVERMKSILAQRATILQSNAHPQLITGIDRQIGTMLCHQLLQTRGMLLQTAGDQEAAVVKARCADYQLRDTLKQLGFTTQTVPCLTARTLRIPEGCR